MNKKTVYLSAIVIARNEEKRIAVCLKSLQFADEIIVINNNSTDQTKNVAKKHHANVFDCRFTDFAELRNFGKSKARGSWLLYIDADEIVPEDCAKEISDIVYGQNARRIYEGYYLTRQNIYLGHPWKVGDRMQRLFKKDALDGWIGVLHESASVKGTIGDIKNPIIHNTHRTLEEMVDKTNEWSNYEAQLRFNAHHSHIVWWRLFRVFMTGFFRSFLKEGGWNMGTVGWIESFYQGFSMFITYAKLWEMQEHE